METFDEVTADDRARLPLGKLGVRKSDRFAASRQADGSIILSPVVSVPKRELIIWENELVRASLARGLAQSASGDLEDLGDFTQHADIEIDD